MNNYEKTVTLTTMSDIINSIFGPYPKEPCFYKLGNPNMYLLSVIMIQGSKKLFGNVTPDNMTEKQFKLLQQYIKSIGYEIKYLVENDKYKIWFEPYSPKITCKGFKFY